MTCLPLQHSDEKRSCWSTILTSLCFGKYFCGVHTRGWGSAGLAARFVCGACCWGVLPKCARSLKGRSASQLGEVSSWCFQNCTSLLPSCCLTGCFLRVMFDKPFSLSLVAYGHGSQTVRIEIKPIKNFSNIIRIFFLNIGIPRGIQRGPSCCALSFLLSSWGIEFSTLSAAGWKIADLEGRAPPAQRAPLPLRRSSCAGCSSARS